MTETAQPRQNILPSDADAQGGVTLWDHGPQEYKPAPGDTEARTALMKEQHDREAAQWKASHGDETVALRMHQSEAAHAMAIEPSRYSMEPSGLDEGEIEKRVQEIKAKREAAANAPQNALDRKAAIDAIMSDRRSAASAAAVSTAAPAQEVAPAPEPLLPPAEPEPIL